MPVPPHVPDHPVPVVCVSDQEIPPRVQNNGRAREPLEPSLYERAQRCRGDVVRHDAMNGPT